MADMAVAGEHREVFLPVIVHRILPKPAISIVRLVLLCESLDSILR